MAGSLAWWFFGVIAKVRALPGSPGGVVVLIVMLNRIYKTQRDVTAGFLGCRRCGFLTIRRGVQKV